jgi:hypothetical protein
MYAINGPKVPNLSLRPASSSGRVRTSFGISDTLLKKYSMPEKNLSVTSDNGGYTSPLLSSKQGVPILKRSKYF